MSDLGMFQDSIPSRSCHQMHTCCNQVSNGDGITILPVEANESNLWSEGKGLCQNSEEGLAWRSLIRYAKNNNLLTRSDS